MSISVPCGVVNNVIGWRYITKVKVDRWLFVLHVKYFFRNFFLCQQYKLFFHWHFFMFFISCLTSVRYYVWQLRSAILLALEMIFFFKYFYAGIVQSNLCWKINNKYVFRVYIHIFVLKYLVQIQIIQNFRRR